MSAAETGSRGEAGKGPLAEWSWALFDWANQPYFTLITTFIFAPYFTAHVVGDAVQGQALWGYTQAAAGLAIALLSPVLGAVADASGRKKPWILVFQCACILACISLWWATPGLGNDIGFIFLALIVAAIGAEFSIVFNNALLPSLVPRDRLGRLSGYAWALGYLGGLVSLIFILLVFVFPEQPPFGIDKAQHEQDRIVGPFSGFWLLIFVLPMFLFTPDSPATGRSLGTSVKVGLAALKDTFLQLRNFRNIAWFLAGRMLYQDGLTAIFAFGGIYAASIFGWSIEELGIFGIILTIFAAVGAAFGGWLDDRIGSLKTVWLAVTGLTVATIGIISITVTPVDDQIRRDTVLFFIHYDVPLASVGGLLSTKTEWVFMVFGIMVGIFGGPTQAASRTLLARLSPPERVASFYGLFALSGKATAFLAPFSVALLTDSFNSQRIGMSCIVVFLLAGLAVVLFVREQRPD